ncbi:MAG: type II toxin-antitoxin system HicB family antitoxin [Burkholderiales bacterium]
MPYLEGGILALVDVDMNSVKTRRVRVNITLPESLLGDLDAGARALGTPRSGLITRAAEELLTREAKRSKHR